MGVKVNDELLVKVTDWAEREFEVEGEYTEWIDGDLSEIEIPNGRKVVSYETDHKGEFYGPTQTTEWIQIDWKYREVSVYDTETEDYICRNFEDAQEV